MTKHDPSLLKKVKSLCG